jgi:hypothetical protein
MADFSISVVKADIDRKQPESIRASGHIQFGSNKPVSKDSDDDQPTKYCATAILDLQGFSSHLELGNDLRTSIGTAAITRLETLALAARTIEAEVEAAIPELQGELHIQRINDALILGIDLPATLTPPIGASVRVGMTYDEFEIDQERVSNLMRFIGIVSRAHNFINEIESEAYHPGVKTIVATGYRRSMGLAKEDYWSANFSFSNSYLAEQFLKGANLFVDSNILQMLSYSDPSHHLMRIATQFTEVQRYDPTQARSKTGMSIYGTRPAKSYTGMILRKEFVFYELWPRALSFFQLMPQLLPIISRGSEATELGEIGQNLALQLTGSDQSHFSLGDIRFDLGFDGLAEAKKIFSLR